MTLNLSHATSGARRFIEFAWSKGYDPNPVKLTEGNRHIQPTTLIYGTDRTYFVVFNSSQRIPRLVTGDLIGSRDLKRAAMQGEANVQREMRTGYMGPFVSEGFEPFRIFLDYTTFKGNGHVAFYLGNEKDDGFSLPANSFRELSVDLYGAEHVKTLYLFQNMS